MKAIQRMSGVLIAFVLAVATGDAFATAVSGQVTRAFDGMPVAGARVTIAGGIFTQPVPLQTDADGRYAYDYDCQSNDCQVWATADGYVEDIQLFHVGEPTHVADFALAREAVVSGKITYPAGFVPSPDSSPEEWPQLYRYDAERDWWPLAAAAYPSADGSFRVDKLRAGTYRVCLKMARLRAQCFDGKDQGPYATIDFTPVVLVAGDIRTGVDLAPRFGGRIDGRAFDGYANASLPDVTAFYLQLFDENGVPVASSSFLLHDEGHYTVEGLAPGRYYAVGGSSIDFLSRIYPNIDCYNDCDARSLGTLVTVPVDGAATGVDFALQPFAVVRAHIVDATTGNDVAGAWMSGWRPLMGGAIDMTRDWYDAATNEYVTYNFPGGMPIAAVAPGYKANFILGGNCDDLDACSANYPPLRQLRGEVLRISLPLTRASDLLFRNGFE